MTAATPAVEQTFYQHTKRPEWGYSAIIDIQDDQQLTGEASKYPG